MIIGVILIISNFICYLYYNPLHQSDINSYRIEPNSKGFQAMEGFSSYCSDSRGFPNKDLPLIDEDYILVMGSSQTCGYQVNTEERYSDVLNRMLNHKDELGVYNVAYSGGKFYDIVHNFKEIIEEFPKSTAIVIEVTDNELYMDRSTYEYALNQVDYDKDRTGDSLTRHSNFEQMKVILKNSFPLVLLVAKQYDAWKSNCKTSDSNVNIMTSGKRGNTETDDNLFDNMEERYIQLANCFRLMKDEYNREIVIVYHNEILPNYEGKIEYKLSKLGDILEKVCENENVSLINMSDAYIENYYTSKQLPYGFNNTVIGEGHLNKTGHYLIAKELYQHFKERNE